MVKWEDSNGSHAVATTSLERQIVTIGGASGDGRSNKDNTKSSRRPNADFSLQGIRVLLVEDDTDTRALIHRLLELRGARVTSTGSAAEALKEFTVTVPDVVVSDIAMPDEDGYSLLRKIRSFPKDRGGQTPAIALTGYASAKDKSDTFAAGYQAHVAKPLEPADLITAIESVLRR
jgi:CheY-like chemotaxis protein